MGFINISFSVCYLLCVFTVYKWQGHNTENQSNGGEKMIRMSFCAEKYVKVWSLYLLTSVCNKMLYDTYN